MNCRTKLKKLSTYTLPPTPCHLNNQKHFLTSSNKVWLQNRPPPHPFFSSCKTCLRYHVVLCILVSYRLQNTYIPDDTDRGSHVQSVCVKL